MNNSFDSSIMLGVKLTPGDITRALKNANNPYRMFDETAETAMKTIVYPVPQRATNREGRGIEYAMRKVGEGRKTS